MIWPKRPIIYNLLLLFYLPGSLEARDVMTVAQDGSGPFRSIQQALDACKGDGPVTILVKNGLYEEKLFIHRSHVAIVGEHRDSTRIVYPELRKNWLLDHASDWGSATVNIDSTVADVMIANLTVHNNYGSLHGDHDHQFAIWCKGTRIIIAHCSVIADGGDTVSLWNFHEGMYYWRVDEVTPEGTVEGPLWHFTTSGE